jgi:hypothetical protein
MRGCITVVAVIVLLVPHHFKGGCWHLRNLWGIFEPFCYGSLGVLRRRLELCRGRFRAIRAGMCDERYQGNKKKRPIEYSRKHERLDVGGESWKKLKGNKAELGATFKQ